MRFSILTDIHITPKYTQYYYKGVNRKLGSHSWRLLEKYVLNMKRRIMPEFIIQLGDVVEGFNYYTDKSDYKKVIELLNHAGCPVFHTVGNHDLLHLPLAVILELSGLSQPFYSFDMGNHHFVVLYSEEKNGSILIPDHQLQWLRHDISVTNLPTVVFSHYSLADQQLSENFWFEGRPEQCLIANRIEVRQILSELGAVVAVFNGHLHWNQVSVHDGIPYITIQSLVENVYDDGRPANAYAVVDITDYELTVKIEGIDSMELVIPLVYEFPVMPAIFH